ncbi:MAG TPA: ribosome-associated translation inhibitor RaiA [Candidatus Angelobacter sp.]|jgi:putative sigma-54 modulation protein|nr:ribosome-associated translation inhibitor RaiA [Candidatus Angelobacter sp.]
MNVEYTGRQYETTPAIRKQIETGLEKIQKILGSDFDTHAILSAEKHRYIAEITVTVRSHPPIVGLAESAEMSAAIGNALDRIDRQAVKYKTKWKSKKRLARKKYDKKSNGTATREEVAVAVAVGGSLETSVPVTVHSFPNVVKFTDAHVVKSADSVSFKPLSLEEAVKEAEFRDREVFVFRDLEGRVKVLHRKKDGKMELIEAP